MAREKEDFRENLALLKELYPGKVTITIQEACTLLGRDKRSLLGDRAFPTQKVGGRYLVPLVALARFLS